MNRTASEVIEKLALEPHPEGGYFREMFRDEVTVEGRSVGTAIYYLLAAGESSHWHRVDASEIWHWYAGDPLKLEIYPDNGEIRQHILGTDLWDGQLPQCVVPARHWQSARSLGEWSLVGCTVSPGFEFAGFEMAPVKWNPGDRIE